MRGFLIESLTPLGRTSYEGKADSFNGLNWITWVTTPGRRQVEKYRSKAPDRPINLPGEKMRPKITEKQVKSELIIKQGIQ